MTGRVRDLMAATIKTSEEIEKMRVAGRLAADVLEMIEESVRPGVSTDELDRICHDYIVNVQDAVPAPLNYRGFPKSICTSLKHLAHAYCRHNKNLIIRVRPPYAPRSNPATRAPNRTCRRMCGFNLAA